MCEKICSYDTIPDDTWEHNLLRALTYSSYYAPFHTDRTSSKNVPAHALWNVQFWLLLRQDTVWISAIAGSLYKLAQCLEREDDL